MSADSPRPEKIALGWTRDEIVDRFARIMRNHFAPPYSDAPPPVWATDAAEVIWQNVEAMVRERLETDRAEIAILRAATPPVPASLVGVDREGGALDQAYRERNAVVAALIRVGGYPARMVPAPDTEPGWWIVYAETPEGQVSWHVADADAPLFRGIVKLPPDSAEWDGHTTDEKYRRVAALAASEPPTPGASAAPELPSLSSPEVAAMEEAMMEVWPSHSEGTGGTGTAVHDSYWQVVDPAVPTRTLAAHLIRALRARAYFIRLATGSEATPTGQRDGSLTPAERKRSDMTRRDPRVDWDAVERLVYEAIRREDISVGRGAEILGITLRTWRDRSREIHAEGDAALLDVRLATGSEATPEDAT